jgi:CPA2 family monovalent cation:H+ antiporter-2
VDHLKQYGASLIIMGEREIARGMTEYILSKVGGVSRHTGDHESRSGGVPVSPVRP